MPWYAVRTATDKSGQEPLKNGDSQSVRRKQLPRHHTKCADTSSCSVCGPTGSLGSTGRRANAAANRFKNDFQVALSYKDYFNGLSDSRSSEVRFSHNKATNGCKVGPGALRCTRQEGWGASSTVYRVHQWPAGGGARNAASGDSDSSEAAPQVGLQSRCHSGCGIGSSTTSGHTSTTTLVCCKEETVLARRFPAITPLPITTCWTVYAGATAGRNFDTVDQDTITYFPELYLSVSKMGKRCISGSSSSQHVYHTGNRDALLSLCDNARVGLPFTASNYTAATQGIKDIMKSVGLRASANALETVPSHACEPAGSLDCAIASEARAMTATMSTGSVAASSTPFRALFCRRCFQYACSTHRTGCGANLCGSSDADLDMPRTVDKYATTHGHAAQSEANAVRWPLPRCPWTALTHRACILGNLTTEQQEVSLEEPGLESEAGSPTEPGTMPQFSRSDFSVHGEDGVEVAEEGSIVTDGSAWQTPLSTSGTILDYAPTLGTADKRTTAAQVLYVVTASAACASLAFATLYESARVDLSKPWSDFGWGGDIPYEEIIREASSLLPHIRNHSAIYDLAARMLTSLFGETVYPSEVIQLMSSSPRSRNPTLTPDATLLRGGAVCWAPSFQRLQRSQLVPTMRNTAVHGQVLHFRVPFPFSKYSHRKPRHQAAFPDSSLSKHATPSSTASNMAPDTSTADTNALYVPCNHDGPCSSENGCACASNRSGCEKYCACHVTCSIRHAGCRCDGLCNANDCACAWRGRECDPDTCGCRAGHASTLTACGNNSIQMGTHARIGVARSRIHGWGAFSLQHLEPGAFIYEYVGERISQAEADRRGSVYDRVARSYIFSTSRDRALDALRYGNKIKFANHMQLANMRSMLLNVAGEHRVAFIARRRIYPGAFTAAEPGSSEALWHAEDGGESGESKNYIGTPCVGNYNSVEVK